MKTNKIELRIAGKGGQGILTAGYLLGKAIAIHEDKNVAQTQSYGPEARGGASRTDLIISDTEIYYTKVRKADYLVIMSQEAYEKYAKDLPEKSILVIDSYVKTGNKPKNKLFSGDFEKIAREEMKNPMTANIIMLGFLCSISEFVKPESLKKVISSHFNKKFEETNFKAFDLGYQSGQKAK